MEKESFPPFGGLSTILSSIRIVEKSTVDYTFLAKYRMCPTTLSDIANCP